MRKQIVAIDIDEVLFPMAPTYLEYHNAVHGTSYTVNDLTSYYIEHLTGETVEQVMAKIEAYLGTAHYKETGPMPGSIEVIRKLSEKYELVVITARDPFYRGSTEEFIAKHYPELFKALHYTHILEVPGKTRPKYEICKEVGAIMLIDDNLSNVIACAERGISSVLFGDYPWNQSDKLPATVIRCKDWAAVMGYFDGRS
ncbi:MAG: hypothetical protein WC498_03025 [Candidatus Saccharimonadales bacterium]